MHLLDRHPDPKGGLLLLRNMSSESPVEDGDGDTESSPNGRNSVPRHPPRFTHEKMH